MPAVETVTPPPRGALPELTPALAALIETVDAACAGASLARGDRASRRIVHALRVAAAQRGLLTADQRATHANGYARHLLYGDLAGRFALMFPV